MYNPTFLKLKDWGLGENCQGALWKQSRTKTADFAINVFKGVCSTEKKMYPY